MEKLPGKRRPDNFVPAEYTRKNHFYRPQEVIVTKLFRYAQSVVCLALCLGIIMGADTGQAETREVKIVYEDWSSEVAAAYLLKAVLKERLGFSSRLVRLGITETYEALAAGKQDVMIGAWLPSQKPYYERFKGQFEDLGPNLENARLGLVVPNVTSRRQFAESGISTDPYMTINSIEDLRDHIDQFEGRIIGIETDSGMMKTMRERLIPAYGLEQFELIPGSEVSMLAELGNAIKHRRWIVLLGWTPHWKFGRWSLKFLDDPKKIWGGEAKIHTLTRKGLKADLPEAVFRLLDNFYWTPAQMERLLLWNEMGGHPYDNALRWMRGNSKAVDEWLK